MPTAIFVSEDGQRRRADVPAGWSLMEGARAADVSGIVAECGGACACATCHVRVDDTWLPRLPLADNVETEMLACTAEPASGNSRLSCQLRMTAELDGIVLYLPATQL
ncbi:ferredoxin, 2Fe-2S [Burkholderia sp. D7]|jgi:2Fe-2S ferredoxin|nr:ferredoxin, 2Fe-2S [Burkholderia sp. D7]